MGQSIEVHTLQISDKIHVFFVSNYDILCKKLYIPSLSILRPNIAKRAQDA